MHSIHVSCVVLIGLAINICNVQADEADVQIVSSGYCSEEILRRKGVDPKKYKSKLIFDPKEIRTIPAKPTVPGCFRLVAKNVAILETVTQVTGEFEMRIGGNADPSKPVLQCKKRQPKCGCGEKDTCMYCDFCKNFKKMVKEGTINNKEIDEIVSPTSCDCNVPKSNYTIDVEVCTPDEQEMSENVPTEVASAVMDGNSFSLFTTLYVYNFRFNSIATSETSAAAATALRSRKARGMIGCYIIGSNISV